LRNKASHLNLSFFRFFFKKHSPRPSERRLARHFFSFGALAPSHFFHFI
jgi:hypothetical protein